MPTIPCFSTPLWCIQPENHRAVNAELLKYIDKVLLRSRVPADANSSAVKGYQSQHFDVSDTPLFSAALQETIKQVSADLMIDPNSKIIVTDCWANINAPGSYNRKHTHANSMISGVYYPRMPENGGQIAFADPRPQAYVLTLPATSKTGFTSKHIKRTPLEGEFVLFPSWLEHSVEENKSESDRVSVAFNIYYS